MMIFIFIILGIGFFIYFVGKKETEKQDLLKKSISGRRTIELNDDVYPFKELRVDVTYRGNLDMWDVENVYIKNEEENLWNSLSDDQKVKTNWKINCYFQDLRKTLGIR